MEDLEYLDIPADAKHLGRSVLFKTIYLIYFEDENYQTYFFGSFLEDEKGHAVSKARIYAAARGYRTILLSYNRDGDSVEYF